MYLYQENAFERVHRMHLFGVWKNLVEEVCCYIKLLYNQIYSLFKVNNELIPPVKVEWGIR